MACCLRYFLFLVLLAPLFSCDDGSNPADVAVFADVPMDQSDGLDVALDMKPGEVAVDAQFQGESVQEIPETVEQTGPFRLAVITDTHFTAKPEHANNIAFEDAGVLLSAMTPEIDLVVNTGDNIEDLFVFPWELENLTQIPIIMEYKAAIEDFYAPNYYITIGNHDDRFFDSFQPDEAPLEYWLDAFKDTESLPATYYFVDHRGFRLVFVDCTDEAFDHDSNDTCTLSPEQLDWLDTTLTTDLPVLLFWHIEIVINEGTELDHPLLAAIYPHKDNVQGVFMGHSHRFRRRLWYDIPFLTTDSVKDQTEPVYHLLECDPDTGTMKVLNEGEIDYGSDSIPPGE